VRRFLDIAVCSIAVKDRISFTHECEEIASIEAALMFGSIPALGVHVNANKQYPFGTLDISVDCQDNHRMTLGLAGGTPAAARYLQLNYNGKGSFRVYGDDERPNYAFRGIDGIQGFGGGKGVIVIDDCHTAPDSNPTGGGIFYVDAGALKYRGSSGTVTTIADA